MRVKPLHAVVLLLGVVLGNRSGPTAAYAQARAGATTKAALIRRVLELTKAAELAVTAMEAAIPAQRAANPQVPKEFWDELAARARRDTSRFVDILVPIYDAQFTAAQLEQLVIFYESPLGRHLIKVQPLITMHSIRGGQQWGAQLGAEVAQDLARRGIRMPRP